jgi:UDP-glucose 4-epimerase
LKVLVTGGAGYIGSVAVERLLERGDEVVVLDNLWRGHAGAVAKDAQLVHVDLLDRAATAKALKATKPEAVLHFAAATLVPESVREPSLYFQTNVTGSQNLLDAMRDAGVSKFVLSSTAAVYGSPDRSPIDEETPKQPINPYGLSKLTVERMLPWHASAYGLRYVVFRYFNVAGATKEHGEDHRPETQVIPVALEVLLGKRPTFNVFGTDYPTPDGTAVRDYVHVVDLVDAHLLALDRIDQQLGAFNLGARDGYSVREIVNAVEKATEKPLPVVYGPRREGDPPALVADARRAEAILGWKPSRSLEEMVASAWDWMHRHPNGYGDE